MALVAKIILQLSLLTLFILFYGLPAFERFNRKETIVVKLKKNSGGVEAPSITVAARNLETMVGWKVNSSEIKGAPRNDLLKPICKHFSNVEQCIDNKTFPASDFIKDILVGFDDKTSLMGGNKVWTSDFTHVIYGKTFTIDPNIKIGPIVGSDQILLLLNQTYVYHVFVHEKNFFLLSDNQLSFPSIHKKVIPKQSGNLFFKMSAIEHIELNVPDDPCEEDEEYKFATCVKESLAAEIGCRPSWDLWTDQARNVCTSFDQHRFLKISMHQICFQGL